MMPMLQINAARSSSVYAFSFSPVMLRNSRWLTATPQGSWFSGRGASQIDDRGGRARSHRRRPITDRLPKPTTTVGVTTAMTTITEWPSRPRVTGGGGGSSSCGGRSETILPRFYRSFCLQSLPPSHSRSPPSPSRAVALAGGIGISSTSDARMGRRTYSTRWNSSEGGVGGGDQGMQRRREGNGANAQRSLETDAGGGGGGGGEGESGENGGLIQADIGLAALADELVWRGDDDDNDDDDGGDDRDSDDESDGGQYGGLNEKDEGRMGGFDIDWSEIEGAADFPAMTVGGGEEDPEKVQQELAREWGSVRVDNDQSVYKVDTTALEGQLRKAMEVLGCQHWDVGVSLAYDTELQQLNAQYRGIDKSTDILSFPMHDMSSTPSVLPKVRHPSEMDLGDMFVSLAYVDRQIARDREEALSEREDEEREGDSNGDSDDDDGVDALPRERGVSGAMAEVYDLQERVSLLLVHGLVHLLGYDHETDEDFEAMVAVEERVLEAMRQPSSSSSSSSSSRS